MDALQFIMSKNVFQFGDTYWHQQSGTVMGTPLAHLYADLFYSIHEESFLSQHPDLFYYKQYIDDVFGIWWSVENKFIDTRAWEQFCDSMDYMGIKQYTKMHSTFTYISTHFWYTHLVFCFDTTKLHT